MGVRIEEIWCVGLRGGVRGSGKDGDIWGRGVWGRVSTGRAEFGEESTIIERISRSGEVGCEANLPGVFMGCQNLVQEK